MVGIIPRRSELGSIGWRGPFYGVSVLMAIALIATVGLPPKTPTPPRPNES
jgi:ACDE family multidrug resistance protein